METEATDNGIGEPSKNHTVRRGTNVRELELLRTLGLNSLIEKLSSENTRRAYVQAIQYWSAWYEYRYCQRIKLPLASSVILQFLSDHLAAASLAKNFSYLFPVGFRMMPPANGSTSASPISTLSFNTLIHRCHVISAAHVEAKLRTPCQDPEVREVLAKLSELKRQHIAQASDIGGGVTRDALQAMIETCDDSLIGMRDKALLLFGWASGVRRSSEIVKVTCDDIRRIPGGFLYRSPSSADTCDETPIFGTVADALQTWMTVAEIDEGLIFRRIWRSGLCIGKSLTSNSVRLIVQRRAVLAGLGNHYNARSLSAGAAKQGGLCALPVADMRHVMAIRAMHPALSNYLELPPKSEDDKYGWFST